MSIVWLPGQIKLEQFSLRDKKHDSLVLLLKFYNYDTENINP